MSIIIKETDNGDLENLRALWADGDVMYFVGFPEGLIRTNAEMKTWLQAINAWRSQAKHFSIYDDGIYCGEAFYGID